MSAKTSFFPNFLVQGIELIKEEKSIDIKVHNFRIKKVANAAIAAIAYVGAFYVAPRLGYTVPTFALVAGALVLPEAAQLAVAGHFFATNVKDGWMQGRTGHGAAAVKAFAKAAFAYVSTTPRCDYFMNTYVYSWVPGYYSN